MPAPRDSHTALAAPLILWRSHLADAAKLVAVTTAGLVVVLAFAVAVKLLADGKVGLADALKVTAVLAVPMLQFALPFAAGFGATMTFHRAAADNEVNAAAAAGVSHRAILTPALALGLALGALLLLLTQQVIPSFLRHAERISRSDFTRLLIAPLEEGRAISLGGFDIRAESVLRLPPGDVAHARELLRLDAVLAVQRADGHDDDAGPTFFNAEHADVWFLDDPRRRGGAVVQFLFRNAITASPEQVLFQERARMKPIRVPLLLGDDPKFLTAGELADALERPRSISGVDANARPLAAALAARDAANALDDDLRAAGRTLLQREGRTFALSSAGLERDPSGRHRVLPAQPDGAIELLTVLDGNADRVQRARSATLTIEHANTPAPGSATRASPAPGSPSPGSAAPGSTPARLGAPLTVTLTLRGVTAGDPGDEGDRAAAAQRDQITLSGLIPARLDLADDLARSVDELLAEARAIDEPGITALADRLQRRVLSLEREILSKRHERYAASAACVVMVVLGAVMALRLREAMPLPVYLWSFLPALGTVIAISAGQQLTHEQGPAGLALLWSGVAALAVLAALNFRAVARH